MPTRAVPSPVLRAISLAVSILAFAPGAPAQPAPEPASPQSAETPAEAPKSAVSFSGDLTLASRYLFQGFDYSEGRAVLQPNASLSYRWFTANVWGNYQIDPGQLNEVDTSLKVGQSFGIFSIAAGYLNLQYPNRPDWDPSQEIFTETSLGTVLNPTLSIHYDFDAGKGTYSALGISHAVGSSITLGTNLFHHLHYYGGTGFPAAEFKVSWQHAVGAYTMTPTVSYFTTWRNHDFRGENSVPSNWLFGANVARAF